MTLLEVVLAAAIMASVVALVMTGYARMAAAASVAKEYREAAELLHGKLAEVYGAEDPATVEAQGTFDSMDQGIADDMGNVQTPLKNAAWVIEITPVQTGLSQVKVTVTWQSNRGQENVWAATLKFLPNEITGQSAQ
jgi:type II secretory pathway pseudopilin PulG